MTPTPGRIVHVGYEAELPNVRTGLACRVAIVSGALTASSMLPVSILTMIAKGPVVPAYVDAVEGWHDPRSCPFPWPQGANDGERSDPNPIGRDGVNDVRNGDHFKAADQ